MEHDHSPIENASLGQDASAADGEQEELYGRMRRVAMRARATNTAQIPTSPAQPVHQKAEASPRIAASVARARLHRSPLTDPGETSSSEPSKSIFLKVPSASAAVTSSSVEKGERFSVSLALSSAAIANAADLPGGDCRIQQLGLDGGGDLSGVGIGGDMVRLTINELAAPGLVETVTVRMTTSGGEILQVHVLVDSFDTDVSAYLRRKKQEEIDLKSRTIKNLENSDQDNDLPTPVADQIALLRQQSEAIAAKIEERPGELREAWAGMPVADRQINALSIGIEEINDAVKTDLRNQDNVAQAKQQVSAQERLVTGLEHLVADGNQALSSTLAAEKLRLASYRSAVIDAEARAVASDKRLQEALAKHPAEVDEMLERAAHSIDRGPQVKELQSMRANCDKAIDRLQEALQQERASNEASVAMSKATRDEMTSAAREQLDQLMRELEAIETPTMRQLQGGTSPSLEA